MSTVDTKTKEKTLGYIGLPCHPKFPRSGGSHVLLGMVRASSVTVEELDTFIEKYGFGPDGRTERCRTLPDGWIELNRTVLNTMTPMELRRKAETFKEHILSCFSSVEISIF